MLSPTIIGGDSSSCNAKYIIANENDAIINGIIKSLIFVIFNFLDAPF